MTSKRSSKQDHYEVVTLTQPGRTIVSARRPDRPPHEAADYWEEVTYDVAESPSDPGPAKLIAQAMARVQAWVSDHRPVDPVGLAEIADRLGVQRQTVDTWRHRGLLPEPRWTVGGRPAWDWPTIRAWAERTGRL